MADPEDVKDELLEKVDKATDPDEMTAEEAYETLDLLATDLHFRMEALKQENEPESADW